MGNSIPVSNAFHQAIKSGERQRALVHFFDDDLYLTNDDVTASGIKYENYFCPEEEFTIGTTQSASISFSVFNENHRLDNMSFGKFSASLGVVTNRSRFNKVGNVCVEYGGDQIVGYRSLPYLRINGVAIDEQPEFPIESVLVSNAIVYCIGSNGEYAAYMKMDFETGKWGSVARYTWNDLHRDTWSDIANTSAADGQYHRYLNASVSEMMIDTLKRYAKRNVCVVVGDDKTITDYMPDGTKETYTYVNLGVFYAERPARTKVNIISIDGHDALGMFDVSTESMQITFPITLKSLLDRVCSFVGVGNRIESFINDDMEIQETSDIFQNTTAREVIGFIAEVACANAKIDQDGYLYFAWWENSDLVIDENDYFEFVPFEYSVKQIDRLQVRNSDSDIGILVGSGKNGYVIQENPFLAFYSDAEGRSRTERIYNRLSSFPEYVPGSVNKWFADWSYRPGDIVSVYRNGVLYRLPVFGYSLNWSGMAIATIESTGNEYREVIDAQHRESFAAGRKMLEIEKSIDGVKITASEAIEKSDGALKKVADLEFTVDGFSTSISKIEEGQEKLSSEFNQTVGSIDLKVSKDEVISAINLSTENVKIKAPKIEFDGAVITNGTLETGNWKFDNNGSNYNGNGIGVNTTILSGEFVGGDSYGTRAFYGSTKCDVQYGSDYDYDTYIRAGSLKLITHKDLNGNSSLNTYGSAYCRLSSGGEFSFLCGESSSGYPKGNIGSNSQRWDTVYVNALHQGSSKYVKHDIQNMRDMGDVIDGLRPVTFVYNNDKNNKIQYGLVYEEAIEVFPHICLPSKSGDVNDIGIDYTRLIAPMLKEIQSLRKRVKALEERM